MAIWVLLVEDHYVTRQGIRTVLEADKDILIAGEAVTGQEALVQIAALQPDVVISDYKLPHITGADLILALREQGLGVPVLILSAYTEPEYVRAAVAAGAKGYMLKTEYGRAIVGAVKEVAGGGTYFSPAIVPLLAAIRETSAINLTPREEAVLRLLARGSNNQEIARALDIEERTVRFHLEQISQKLGVQGRGKLMAWAWQHGYGEK